MAINYKDHHLFAHVLKIAYQAILDHEWGNGLEIVSVRALMSEEKEEVLTLWKQGGTDVMVATSAFALSDLEIRLGGNPVCFIELKKKPEGGFQAKAGALLFLEGTA
ncbi:hypothetical protein DFS34DRAFT_594795 [Phlyctochytrium arcticum]|nr:hypothetical protein DFS34DRAFT_594795 [Phlyctochytrium arcticum]